MYSETVRTEAREVFNMVISKTQDPEKKAGLEILREYFTNPDFKKCLEEITYNINTEND